MNLRQRFHQFVDEPKERFGFLLMLLLTSLMVTGFGRQGGVRFSAALLNLGILALALTSSRLTHRHTVLAVLGVVGLVGSIAVATLPMGEPTGALGATAQALVLFGATFGVVDRIARHETVSTQTLMGAVSAYLLVGHAFAWLFLAMPGYFDDQVISPAAAGEVPMYYSYVVLTTLGFGDITPTGALAQRLTVLEALTGQLFVGVLIARLVSRWSRPNRSGAPDVE